MVTILGVGFVALSQVILSLSLVHKRKSGLSIHREMLQT